MPTEVNGVDAQGQSRTVSLEGETLLLFVRASCEGCARLLAEEWSGEPWPVVLVSDEETGPSPWPILRNAALFAELAPGAPAYLLGDAHSGRVISRGPWFSRPEMHADIARDRVTPL